MIDIEPTLNRGNPDLIRVIEEEIASSDGSISFTRFMNLALYHPRFGYYMSDHRRPGRGGDFITSPEISPLFGHALSRQMVEFWERLGQPAAWSVREYGSGIGGLAYDILAGLDHASSAAFEGLTYRMVELNPAMRAEATRSMNEAGLAEKVLLEHPAENLDAIEGVVLANEVVDAFPALRLIKRDGVWSEAHVGSSRDGFSWQYKQVSAAGKEVLRQLENDEIDIPQGSVVDAIPAASDWFGSAVRPLDRGFAMVIDYGYQAADLYRDHRLMGTIRGYQGHTVTDDPLIRVGEQDLTAHVDFSDLQRAGEIQGMEMAGFTTQGAMLSSLDMGQAIVDLQTDPDVTMEEYLATQSVVLRLIDPGGLGRFGVLIMCKDVGETGNPLKSFRDPPPSF